MIISEGTFNCFLSTLSNVAKTPSEDCQLSQIYSSVGRDHGWDGKFLIPRNIHIVICIFSGLLSGQTAAGPGLSVAARTVPAYCVLSVLTCCVGDGTHLASSGRPSCPHPSTWSAASWPPQPPAASRASSPLALAASPSLLVSRPRVSVQGLLVTSLVLAVLLAAVSGVCGAVSPAQLTTPCRPAGAQHSGQKLAPPPPAFCCCHTHRHRRDKKVHP